jgi:membrane protein YdbS with pleckstrin-like domain
MPTKRTPSKRVRIGTRITLALSQAVAAALCLYAVHNGIIVGWFGAAGCAMVATIMVVAADTEATL